MLHIVHWWLVIDVSGQLIDPSSRVKQSNAVQVVLLGQRYPTGLTLCLCWTAMVGGDSFWQMCLYASCYVQWCRAQCV